MSTLRFLGATDTVTGSRYLLETGSSRVLVDAGLFQGPRRLRERNWSDFPVRPSSLDAVVLTHAHIDHSGYLPRLHRQGFRGPVLCTEGTADLLRILLPDSGYLQEEDARRAARGGYSRHQRPLPLYTRAQAEASLELLSPVRYGATTDVATGVDVRFGRAGHILGSAWARLQLPQLSVTFTGDVGRPIDPIMKPASELEPTDYLVTESTYGDRTHPAEDVRDVLARAIIRTANLGGTLLVPAFAVGRAQHILHLVAELKRHRQIPDVPVFLDSPMAINATSTFCKHAEDHRLTREQCHAMCNAATYSHTPEDSRAIDSRTDPMVVISASGMVNGGRILHHMRRFLPDPASAVLFVGYQASGTRGRALLDGTDEVRIHGQYVRVRATILQAQGLSAHSDYRELLDWLKRGRARPRQTFVTHGEPPASEALRHRLADELGWRATVPQDGSRWPLESAHESLSAQ